LGYCIKYIENKLSNNESEKCEGEITIEECTNAIFKIKLSKAPGLDGLRDDNYPEIMDHFFFRLKIWPQFFVSLISVPSIYDKFKT
jgi:hypothetical protein